MDDAAWRAVKRYVAREVYRLLKTMPPTGNQTEAAPFRRADTAA
ncbi:MAG: hypothetical protein ACR2MZ_01325 [Candidatus Dormibacter sp.]